MPSRYVIKEFAPECYYHVYNRGVAKQPIFIDANDKKQFLKIIRRHLDASDKSTKADGVPYRKFDQDLELLCYCLMGNHFHLLLYIQGEGKSLSTFMQSALTAYSMYFNKRYKRVGTLFQGVFKATRITNEEHLLHITRYIHMNPRSYKTYYYSSLAIYLGKSPEGWLKPHRITDLFENEDYLQFIEDYEDQKRMYDLIKDELADS